MAQLIEPDEVDGDIYDEIANLENWQSMLSDLIANNDISQEEFDSEMLKTRYYLDIKTKTYVLDDDDAEIIEKLRKYKSSLTENYKFGIISEKEFNREYISILRKEYDILKLSENDQGSIKFEGLNKPKEVKRTTEQRVGEDGKLRAKYRKIFLTLRNENGKLKSIKQLKHLIAHELTHTAMNHVRWREDDHDEKFNYYNKLILRYLLLN